MNALLAIRVGVVLAVLLSTAYDIRTHRKYRVAFDIEDDDGTIRTITISPAPSMRTVVSVLVASVVITGLSVWDVLRG